ncbi:MAG: pyrroloquinoline quinone biosynthesis peptide chaperone PqqD [Rhodobacteraceae bacterium]|nr:pyrroloquinoline quinone biosynthesis peptide chaperone PqqD [Paracoccaceae bacterium]
MTAASDIPVLPRGVRLHPDRVRGLTVLLAPERVLTIDATGAAILSRVDGRRSIGEIAADLARAYAAPAEVIAPDVIDFLQDLAEKRMVDLRHG